ncbi:hypothetical protein PSP6_410042 [Paraburkholderia tropica]|nr:hypothetical protein PSP6_410042 [Paraburkholderia tropica]
MMRRVAANRTSGTGYIEWESRALYVCYLIHSVIRMDCRDENDIKRRAAITLFIEMTRTIVH